MSANPGTDTAKPARVRGPNKTADREAQLAQAQAIAQNYKTTLENVSTILSATITTGGKSADPIVNAALSIITKSLAPCTATAGHKA